MGILFALLLAFSAQAANVPISGLPLGSAAATGMNDSFPYVDATADVTRRLKLSDIKNIPSLAAAIAGAGGGSSGLTVISISASYTLAAGSPVNYQHVACDASAAPVVATLPLCAGNVGQVFNLKKIDASSNSCGFARTGADLIDGQVAATNSQQFIGLSVVCRAAGFWDVL